MAVAKKSTTPAVATPVAAAVEATTAKVVKQVAANTQAATAAVGELMKPFSDIQEKVRANAEKGIEQLRTHYASLKGNAEIRDRQARRERCRRPCRLPVNST